MQAATIRMVGCVGTKDNANIVVNLAPRIYLVPAGFLALPVQLSRAKSVAQNVVLEILFQTKSSV